MEINLAIIDFNPGQGGGVKPSGTLDISENGVYNVYNYASASVDVHPSTSLSETYISNGSYNITGEFNGGVITVDVPAPQFVTETLSVSANGTYTPSEGIDGYSQVVVDVPAPQFITETLNVSENGTYNPGEGIDGYSQVVVDVPQSVTGYTQKEITEGLNIVNLSNSASYVAGGAFRGKGIVTVNLPYATSVGDEAFRGCGHLNQFNLPMCSYIGESAFYVCHNLLQVDLPMCSYIANFAFNGCWSISQVNLPVCNHIGYAAIADCSYISQVNLPMCNYISDYAFIYNNLLSRITIGYSGVCSLNNSNAFNDTQITSSTGSIYVPASLVDAYKSAKNWSYFSTQIFPIE